VINANFFLLTGLHSFTCNDRRRCWASDGKTEWEIIAQFRFTAMDLTVKRQTAT